MPDSEASPDTTQNSDWRDYTASGFFFLGLLFLVFFSVEAIANWPGLWARIAIAASCLLPLFFLALKPRVWKRPPTISKELIFVSAVILIGFINTQFAENYSGAVKGMGLFVLTGAIPFWTGLHLFRFPGTRTFFYWVCTLGFFLLCAYGVYQLLNMAPFAENIKFISVTLFQDNPIPAGAILILLSVGPLSLLTHSGTRWTRKLMVALIASGAVVLILIGQRGLLLALFVMVLVWAVLKMRNLKLWLSFIAGVLVLAVLVFSPEKLPDRMRGKLENLGNIAYRAESLLLGGQLFMEHPVFGRGMDASYEKFPGENYQTRFLEKNRFQNIMRSIKTFDNAYLTLVVEMGGLMVIAYAGIFILAVARVLGSWANLHNISAEHVAWLSVLAGFAVHSITFDSFRYPALNYMGHVLLALMICQKPFTGPWFPFRKPKNIFTS